MAEFSKRRHLILAFSLDADHNTGILETPHFELYVDSQDNLVFEGVFGFVYCGVKWLKGCYTNPDKVKELKDISEFIRPFAIRYTTEWFGGEYIGNKTVTALVVTNYGYKYFGICQQKELFRKKRKTSRRVT